MARFDVQVNLDCRDPELVMGFWAALLGYDVRGSLGPFTAAADPEGRGPKVVVQQVPEGKTVKNRMHLDLYVTDYATWQAEIARALELGAQVVPGGEHSLDDEHWQVLADPEGNEFCICTTAPRLS